ncbi:MAG: hypothetical protein DHS80DRAFT_22249 [Piptocephalis tieghemiana]|nr:MAG: hypothetical protein DHS80DRAFT_22249 [Piptocephalis tieghemiana]
MLSPSSPLAPTLLTLPTEILQRLLSYLPLPSKVALMRTHPCLLGPIVQWTYQHLEFHSAKSLLGWVCAMERTLIPGHEGIMEYGGCVRSVRIRVDCDLGPQGHEDVYHRVLRLLARSCPELETLEIILNAPLLPGFLVRYERWPLAEVGRGCPRLRRLVLHGYLARDADERICEWLRSARTTRLHHLSLDLRKLPSTRALAALACSHVRDSLRTARIVAANGHLRTSLHGLAKLCPRLWDLQVSCCLDHSSPSPSTTTTTRARSTSIHLRRRPSLPLTSPKASWKDVAHGGLDGLVPGGWSPVPCPPQA